MSSPVLVPVRTKFLGDDNSTVGWSWIKFFQSIQLLINKTIAFLITGTHAQRASFNAANFADGTLYQETDRQAFYVVIKGVWAYFTGTMITAQSGLPGDLGNNDIGFLAFVSDYGHLLAWQGSTWDWAPGEEGSDMIVQFLSGPNLDAGWQACDGSTVLALQGDGSVSQVTVPVTPGSWYRQ